VARYEPSSPDLALLLAGGAVLAVALGLWAGGTAAAWIWHRRLVGVPPTSALLLLVRTLAAPGHPARAWPRHAALPPAPILGAAESGGGIALLLLPVLVWRHVAERAAGPRVRERRLARRRRRLLPSVPPPVAGRWARRRDLELLHVRHPTAGRLTLGRSGRHLLAAERRASLVVLGPSQSGKTTGLAIPAILEWQGPVVATSVKADLVRDTIDARSARGPTWVFDPTGATGRPASGWSPLAASGGWQGARRTAAWLCAAARAGPASGAGDEDFWYAAAGKLLAPYLLAAAVAGRDLAHVVRWIDAQEEAEVAHILEAAGELDALGAAGASWQRDDRTRSSVFTTAEMVLEAYADPLILSSAAVSDIDPGRLLGGGMPTLYICAPGHEQERLRPVFATLLQTIITAAYDMALWRGGTLDPPLLLVLDEAANIAPLRDLDTIASTAAGHGIQLVTVWQDLAQLRARYGEKASTVINNHRAKLVLSGISDPATLEYASRLIGDGDVADHSFTVDPSGARSTTRSRRERRLAPDAELRRIRPGDGVLVYGHLPPARLRLRPWFEQRSGVRGPPSNGPTA
jgi:type IV secretion system protein VirD4